MVIRHDKPSVPNELGDCDSYLGITPICDVCKRDVVPGDAVIQTFTGIVQRDVIESHGFDEMGIVQSSYSLIHVRCTS